jgi:hypothetical protein
MAERIHLELKRKRLPDVLGGGWAALLALAGPRAKIIPERLWHEFGNTILLQASHYRFSIWSPCQIPFVILVAREARRLGLLLTGQLGPPLAFGR